MQQKHSDLKRLLVRSRSFQGVSDGERSFWWYPPPNWKQRGVLHQWSHLHFTLQSLQLIELRKEGSTAWESKILWSASICDKEAQKGFYPRQRWGGSHLRGQRSDLPHDNVKVAADGRWGAAQGVGLWQKRLKSNLFHPNTDPKHKFSNMLSCSNKSIFSQVKKKSTPVYLN